MRQPKEQELDKALSKGLTALTFFKVSAMPKGHAKISLPSNHPCKLCPSALYRLKLQLVQAYRHPCSQVFEAMFKTTPALMLQLYVVALEYFVHDQNQIDWLPIVSTMIGILSLCSGISSAYVGEEGFIKRSHQLH